MMIRSALVCFLSVVTAFGVLAATPKKSVARRVKAKTTAVAKPAAPVQTAHRRSPYVGAISADAQTGQILFADNADTEAYPASVTKLMTLLLVLDDVKAGRYGLDDMVTATADAYKSEPSWVGIKVDEKMSVRCLCTALMVESANDAAIVLGVHSAGSFEAFVARMNARAAELGMKHTHYHNPNGLPPNAAKRYPWKSFNTTTARDQLLLARELVKRPEAMSFTSVKTCDLVKTSTGCYYVVVTRRTNEPQHTSVLAADYGKKIAQVICRKSVMRESEYECCSGGKTLHVAKTEQLAFEWCFKNGFDVYCKQLRNHNNVMRTDKLKIVNADGKEAVDGLKTGYIDAGGSSVVLTGTRASKRVIVVVLGSASSKERDYHAHNMMEDALSAVAW